VSEWQADLEARDQFCQKFKPQKPVLSIFCSRHQSPNWFYSHKYFFHKNTFFRHFPSPIASSDSGRIQTRDLGMMRQVIGDDISIKSANVKLNINDVCNLISVSSERFN
jgi:hypothetical protein